MALHLHTSNRLGILARELAQLMRGPQPSALAPEIIVVQSRGMQRWLSLRLARELGICANCTYPFPNQFFLDMAAACLPGLPNTQAFEREALAWRIMGLLPGLGEPGPAAYLEGDTGLKRYQLACRVADLFDQYAIYRPDMLAAWEQGRLCHEGDQHEPWQARLWRGLAAQGRGSHRGRLLEDFLAALERGPAGSGVLPARVAVFGISALPPYHIRFFEALAGRSQVHLYLLNPCREYWGDILTPQQASRLARRRGKLQADIPDEALHLERGNSLLAAWGAYGREFHELLLASPSTEQELFAEEKNSSLLACIKDDILNLRDRGAGDEPRTAIPAGDDSLQIHSCHSPMREVEALHAALLSFFESEPGLAPHDILVMTPDLETYGPFVQAVFGAPDSERLRIPFSMADQSFLRVYPLYEAVLELISLSQSRFGAPQVLAVLEAPAVQQRFGLSAGDVELVRGWVAKTRIRWGRDAGSRLQEGFAASPDNTWQAGLERLLLGYAMPGDNGQLFSGLLPYGAMEGASAQVLGRCAEFLETLFRLSGRLQGEKTLADWSGLLQDMLADFFLPDAGDEARLLDQARELCAELARLQELSGFSGRVGLEIVREHLKKAFTRQVTAAGFLTGAVTVCAMLPMRSIPFRIICLLGMNDGSFPRTSRPPAFDLIARYGRPCDRSAKKDDRYLFLETLVSAGRKLLVTYTGQSMTDNTAMAPSTLVSQLVDYAEQGFTSPKPGQSMRDFLVTRHRLQPFSPAYFEAGRLRSFSLRDFGCAQAIRQGSAAELPLFFASALPEPDECFRETGLEDLCNFLKNPCRYLLQKRLGVYFEPDEALLQDREPFELSGLEKYALEQELLSRRLAGADAQELYLQARSQGILPHGSPGELAFERSIENIDEFIKKLPASPEPSPEGPALVSVQAGSFRLTGQLSSVRGSEQILYRFAKVKPADFLSAWVYHLALCAQGAGDTTLLYVLDKEGSPQGWRFSRPDNPQALLAGVLDLYWQGLRQPLPFFPRASWAFAEKLLLKNAGSQAALGAGLDGFEGSEHTPGDGKDPSIGLCFRSGQFDEEAFMELAERIYGPLLAHRSTIDDSSR